MIRRFAVGTALVTGLTLSLTGCLGEAGDKAGQTQENMKLSAAQVLDKAAEKTGQTDTFQADFDMSVQSPEGNAQMSGAMQYRLKPDLAYSMKYDQMKVAGQSMGGMQQVLVDDTMYMKMPMLNQMGGSATKPWIKISLDELGKKAGLNLDQLLEQTRQMDPVQNTEMLTASKDVRQVGTERVDGVDTTHFAGTYKLADAIGQLPADQREQARQAMAKAGYDSMKFDVWVDGDQLPRKLAMSTPQGSKIPMTMTMTYRDYGEPVQVQAPPAGQVTDFGQLMKQLGGGLGGA